MLLNWFMFLAAAHSAPTQQLQQPCGSRRCRNGMDDALKLQGYLMKEKSKFSRLHGLTGDINKRYFRIRNIEGSEELALCYYKNRADPEVRGWIYLTDVTEIAERQDTIILTSVARTLHLYAQTRAQHSAWVSGLAKLCPDALTMLERRIPQAADRIPQTDAVPSSPKKLKPVDAPLTEDDGRSPNDAPAAGGLSLLSERQVSLSADEEELSPSTDENEARPEFIESPREKEKPMRRRKGNLEGERVGDRRGRGKEQQYWSPPRSNSSHVTRKRDQDYHASPGGKERGTKARYTRNRSLHDGTRPKHLDSSLAKLGKVDKKGQTRCTDKVQPTRRRKENGNQRTRDTLSFEEQDRVTEMATSPNSTCRSTDDTDDVENNSSSTKVQSQDCQKTFPENQCDNDGPAHFVETPRVEQPLDRAPQLVRDLNTARVKNQRNATDQDEGGVVRSEANSDRNPSPSQSRLSSSDNENVDIELDEGARQEDTHVRVETSHHRVVGEVQQDTRDPTPAKTPNGSDKSEEKELDEETDVDVALPHLEIGTWPDPRREPSATSQPHRHVSHADTEVARLDVDIPPPKEFLKSTSPEPVVTTESGEGRDVYSRDGSLNSEHASSVDVPKSVPKGRRRSAADLVWDDNGRTPDSNDCTPLDLGDSEDDDDDCLDLDLEKQRRRASAAVLALEAAAKEADERALAEGKALNDCKRSSNNPPKRKGSKGCPSPVGPPPPEFVRKARRGQGIPPFGVAPPKAIPPARIKAATRRIDADTDFVRDNWDDETRPTCNVAPVARARDSRDLAAAVASPSGTLLASNSGQHRDDSGRIDFDD